MVAYFWNHHEPSWKSPWRLSIAFQAYFWWDVIEQLVISHRMKFRAYPSKFLPTCDITSEFFSKLPDQDVCNSWVESIGEKLAIASKSCHQSEFNVVSILASFRESVKWRISLNVNRFNEGCQISAGRPIPDWIVILSADRLDPCLLFTDQSVDQQYGLIS